MTLEKRVCIGITGASGSIYAERLIELLLPQVDRIYIIATKTGKQVVNYELSEGMRAESFDLMKALKNKGLSEDQKKVIRVCRDDDFFEPAASGSAVPTEMVIIPSSMGTIGRIAHGVSSSLIERAADVMLKQHRPLIICPRETPFNRIHLKNLLEISDAGAKILPLMPAFYQNPKNMMDLVDFCVGRVIDLLGLDHTLYKPWNEPRI